jgi:hypothetical protein
MSVAEFTERLRLQDVGALQTVHQMLGLHEKKKYGYIYAFVSADMPHLVKIGRTVNLTQRFKEANNHDTYKPPTGYTCLTALYVEDMFQSEADLHRLFAPLRRKNVHNHSTEFFEVDCEKVRFAFSQFKGTPVEPVLENETKNVRELLRTAVKANQPCVYRLNNPKHPGTKCHARYERYKHALSMNEAYKLGTFEDILYDYNAGFLVLK